MHWMVVHVRLGIKKRANILNGITTIFAIEEKNR
jgi:hypothetical protein